MQLLFICAAPWHVLQYIICRWRSAYTLRSLWRLYSTMMNMHLETEVPKKPCGQDWGCCELWLLPFVYLVSDLQIFSDVILVPDAVL